MKKEILLIALAFMITRPVYAKLPNPIEQLKSNIIQFVVPIGSVTPTNTPIPTVTPTSQPTQTPTGTITVQPTTTISVTTSITPTVEPSIEKISETETTVSLTPSPTPTPTPSPFTQKDTAIAGVIGLLIIIVIFQGWPKIKTWLHEKTKE